MPYNLYKPENKHILYFDERQLKIYNYKKKKNEKSQYHSDTMTSRTKNNNRKQT